ncbi:hypothetical protein SAICODRAFT_28880 [Saitoella complicata NRRL Y-17804]|uniref:Uncharacterized protein n=1 Tax=Saitoella complicata (strain BCRC 22490 / CBS 7301 / JCM 7358 / NBRC 10748 / NRRL Y-17804) TaxID=698492 RepID=A0A0E9NAA4_SAICN|nr:uncharacterized protein SAICODRAFT_28880 [Saitoella complicata NRRL Y-17804]ODQ55908.1 hypothetical protein SAICODRAFT_28880 [Saitoella complicata NRRL Y-17804]GAO46817.1 hypothetical protein G7K_1035-t1 [Saitoella complicata NRRL Y-17804]
MSLSAASSPEPSLPSVVEQPSATRPSLKIKLKMPSAALAARTSNIPSSPIHGPSSPPPASSPAPSTVTEPPSTTVNDVTATSNNGKPPPKKRAAYGTGPRALKRQAEKARAFALATGGGEGDPAAAPSPGPASPAPSTTVSTVVGGQKINISLKPAGTPQPQHNPKLGPKANMGVINERLRNLDRSGKPCRRWVKKDLVVKNYFGGQWSVPRGTWIGGPTTQTRTTSDMNTKTSTPSEDVVTADA